MIDTMEHIIQIIPIPAFKDNYIWLIHNGEQATIVDPGDAAPVFETLMRLNLKLNTILVTHHHHDHIGGVAELLEAYPNANVFAPQLEQYAFQHHPVGELNTISLNELSMQLTIISLPGHTLGHIAYYAENINNENVLFCGDTLFGAGCGRIFEGTPAQMHASLKKLAALPPNTKVYCTHEYTMHNINFALSLEPNNQALINRSKETLKLRALNLPSLPSTIALELATNPFLRCQSAEIQSSAHLNNASDLEVFTIIRELRNVY